MNVKQTDVCKRLLNITINTYIRINVLKMRYKDQVLSKINQLENFNRTLDFQLSRGESYDVLLQTLADMKEKIEDLHSTVSLEHDEFSTYV